MTDKLIEIPSGDWEQLRELFKTNWPENIISYYTIDNFIRWFKQNPNIQHLNVYSLNGDWSDGTFLIMVSFLLFKLKFVVLYIRYIDKFSVDAKSIDTNYFGTV